MTKTSAETPSKWNPSQYISTSEDEENGASADSVGRRVKFTRGKNTKELAKATASALSEFKIPKKECPKLAVEPAQGSSIPETPKSVQQAILAPSGG